MPSTPNKKTLTIGRKQALKKLGKTVAKTTLPFALPQAFYDPVQAPIDKGETAYALNLILQVEFAQNYFYDEALRTNGVIESPYRTIFNEMRQQQVGHIKFIKKEIARIGMQPHTRIFFDFSAGGTLAPFDNFESFLAIAQIFEDLAVGVYKSQLKKVHENKVSNSVIRLVSRAHTTESRHACFIRQLRAQHGFDDIQGWVSDTNNGTLPDIIPNIYEKEDQTNQADIPLASISEVGTQALKEAWDEPIDRAIATEIIGLFS